MRKLKTKAQAEALADKTVEVGIGYVAKSSVRSVSIESRPVITLRLDQTVTETSEWIRPFIRGSIVRVEPGVDMPDGAIVDAIKALREAGAAAVRVMPKPVAGVVAPTYGRPYVGDVPGVRAVVMAMVDEARVDDREALRSVVEEALCAEGI